ncbi:MAG: TolC family protein [Planctomycetes bacterium]|nr:TolC family protein [Planctomycetota bacterium]
MRRPLRLRGRASLCVVALCATVIAGAAEPTTAPSTAPSTTSPNVLTTVSDLIHAAATADAGLRSAEARAVGADAAGRFAQRWDDPRLGLEGGRVSLPGDDEWHGRIDVTQRLPLGGEGAARAASADSQRALARADYVSARLTLAADVRRLVVNLRLALAEQTATRTSLEDASAAFAVVRTRLAAASARQAELLMVQIDRDEADEAAALASQRVVAARAALARRCHVDLTTIGDPAPLTLSERDQAAVAAAAARHPRLITAEAQVRAAEALAALARSGRWSEVRAGVFGERVGDDTEVGLTLEVPLPTWNRNQGAVGIAMAEADAVRATRAGVRQQVESEAEAAWFAWDAARRRAHHHNERLLPLAGEVLQLALADYAAGRGDLTSVVAARRTRSRLALAAAEAAAQRDHALIIVHTAAPVAEDLP